MLHYTLRHGFDGPCLIVERGARWRFIASRAIEVALCMAGHPCCWRGLGRLPGVGRMCYRALVVAADFDLGHREELATIPLDTASAEAISTRLCVTP